MSSPLHEKLLRSAIAHHQAGRLATASAEYARAIALAPRDFQTLHLAGAAALQEGRIPVALDHLRRAVKLQPRSAPTLMCLGLAYSAAGDRRQAEAHLRAALKRDPRNAEAWGNLGAIQIVSGRISDAIEAYRKSVEVSPRYAQGWTGLGSALLLSGRASEALPLHERALAIEPAHAAARYGRAQALLACQRIEEAAQDFATYLNLQPEHHQAHSYWLFTRNYGTDATTAELYADHLEFGRRVRAPASPPCLPNDRSPDRRLRLAFLSPDLRTHSVAHFLEPLLVHLDRSEFEIVLYHDHYSEDDVSQRLRSLAAVWRNFVGQPDASVESRIRADAPDVLVDLSGHGGMNRLPLYARRLAPVQINYLGYPNTTGLPAMDYRFTDAIADPPGSSDALHSEKLVRFAPSAWSYLPPADAPAVAPLPCETGDEIIFGSFNLAAKLNDFTLGLWSRVLNAVPRSRLVLKSFGLTAEGFRPRLERVGLDPARVEVLPPCRDIPEHLACYARMDIALDPYPYAGTTTTCEALWMGRPVFTLAGDRHASRVGVSLLEAINRPDWVAANADAYVASAAGLALDRSALVAASRALRGNMESSPLLDHAGQAQRFGQAVRRVWLAWAVGSTAASAA